MRALLLSLSLACGFAWADGVPLLSPRLGLSTSAVATSAVAKSVVPVVVNANAIYSQIVTIDIGGRTYRFVGQLTDTADGRIWMGTAPEGVATIRSSRFGTSATVEVDHRVFHVAPNNGRPELVELGRTRHPLELTPEMADAQRNRNAQKKAPTQ